MPVQKTLRTCSKGHQYYKSTDCPTCPICEAQKKPKEGFLSLFGAPARRALEASGIKSAKQLANYSEKEILQLHGIGKSSIPIMVKAMQAEKLKFKPS